MGDKYLGLPSPGLRGHSDLQVKPLLQVCSSTSLCLRSRLKRLQSRVDQDSHVDLAPVRLRSCLDSCAEYQFSWPSMRHPGWILA